MLMQPPNLTDYLYLTHFSYCNYMEQLRQKQLN